MKKSGIDYFVTIVPFLLVLALVLLYFLHRQQIFSVISEAF